MVRLLELVGGTGGLAWVAAKAVLMFTVAVIGLRLGERRTLAQLGAFDFAVAVAIGAINGRSTYYPVASHPFMSPIPRRAGVVLFYRGARCPYCNAQLRAFQRASANLTGAFVNPDPMYPQFGANHEEDRRHCRAHRGGRFYPGIEV